MAKCEFRCDDEAQTVAIVYGDQKALCGAHAAEWDAKREKVIARTFDINDPAVPQEKREAILAKAPTAALIDKPDAIFHNGTASPLMQGVFDAHGRKLGSWGAGMNSGGPARFERIWGIDRDGKVMTPESWAW